MKKTVELVKALLERMSVVALPTRVSLESKRVTTLVVAVVRPFRLNWIFLVGSVTSAKRTLVVTRVLLVKVSVVALPTMVSVVVGRVRVPVLVMAEMTGEEEKVLTPEKI